MNFLSSKMLSNETSSNAMSDEQVLVKLAANPISIINSTPKLSLFSVILPNTPPPTTIFPNGVTSAISQESLDFMLNADSHHSLDPRHLSSLSKSNVFSSPNKHDSDNPLIEKLLTHFASKSHIITEPETTARLPAISMKDFLNQYKQDQQQKMLTDSSDLKMKSIKKIETSPTDDKLEINNQITTPIETPSKRSHYQVSPTVSPAAEEQDEEFIPSQTTPIKPPLKKKLKKARLSEKVKSYTPRDYKPTIAKLVTLLNSTQEECMDVDAINRCLMYIYDEQVKFETFMTELGNDDDLLMFISTLVEKVKDSEYEFFANSYFNAKDVFAEGHDSDDLERQLCKINGSIESCYCLLMFVYGVSGIETEKNMIKENVLTTCINFLKNQLTESFLKPINKLGNLQKHDNPKSNLHLLSSILTKQKKTISSQFCKLSSSLTKSFDVLAKVLGKEMLHDDLVIPVSFFALSVFFVEGSTLSDMFSINILQNTCISILQTIFSNYPSHRTFILEEILNNIIKTTTTSSKSKVLRSYKLNDGKSIQMTSALLLFLISSVFDLNKKISIVDKSTIEGYINGDKEITLKKMMSLFKNIPDQAIQVTHFLLKFLLSRSFPSNPTTPSKKSLTTTTEGEFRASLDFFIKDVLTVLGDVEWHAAEIVSMVYTSLMIHKMDDTSSDTPMKLLALDWLGTMCNKIRIMERNLDENEIVWFDGLKSVGQVHELWGIQKEFLQLCDVSEDRVFGTSFIYKWANQLFEFMERDEFEQVSEDVRSSLVLLSKEYAGLLIGSSALITDRLQSTLPSNFPSTAKDLHPYLLHQDPLFKNFDHYISRINTALSNLDENNKLKSKALKSFGEILMVDSTLLFSNPRVQKIILQRLGDSTIGVRDAVLEILGKLVHGGGIDAREVAKEYYAILVPRVHDVGTNIRKRVVKIFKDIYLQTLDIYIKSEILKDSSAEKFRAESDYKMMSDIIVRLISVLNDEEDTVKELATKSLQDLMFGDFTLEKSSGIKESSLSLDELIEQAHSDITWSQTPTQTQLEVNFRARILMDACIFKDRNALDETFFNQILKTCLHQDKLEFKVNVKKGRVVRVCKLVVEGLMDMLLEFDKAGDKANLHKCVNLLYEFSKSFPKFLSPYISTLHPYLKIPHSSPYDSNEFIIAKLVIKIITDIIPQAADAELSLLKIIEVDLVDHIFKSNQKIIEVVAPCLCSIVLSNTKNYSIVCKIFFKCFDMIKKVSAQHNFPRPAFPSAVRAISILSSLTRYFDLEKLKDDVVQTPTIEEIYKTIILFCGESKEYTCQLEDALKSELISSSISSLGQVCMRYPKLLIRDDAIQLFTRVLNAEKNNGQKFEVMKIFVEYLKYDQKKMIKREVDAQEQTKGINIEVLIGNADEMGEAGISSCLMQRFFDRINSCLFQTSDPRLTREAFEVLIITLEQGLVYPMDGIPALVAMETIDDKGIRDRAFKMHTQLNEKYHSLINGANLQCIKKAVEYQLAIQGFNVKEFVLKGYRVFKNGEGIVMAEPFLSRMFQVVHSKKPRRNEFLMTLVNLFDPSSTTKDPESIDITFCRFLADNLALFEYKTVEEVLHILHYASKIISVTADNCWDRIRGWNKGEKAENNELAFISKLSISMGILMLLKIHLQLLYGISDSKQDSYIPSSSKSLEKNIIRSPTTFKMLPIDYKKMPFAVNPMTSEDDFWEQTKMFDTLMDEHCSLRVDRHLETEILQTPAKVSGAGSKPGSKRKSLHNSANPGETKKAKKEKMKKISPSNTPVKKEKRQRDSTVKSLKYCELSGDEEEVEINPGDGEFVLEDEE